MVSDCVYNVFKLLIRIVKCHLPLVQAYVF